MTYSTLIKKGEVITDIYTEWGIVAKDFPFLPLAHKPKNIYSRDYHDQNEAYYYMPETTFYEGLNFSVPFIFQGSRADAFTKVQGFINHINDGEFSIYNQYTLQGRQKVRLIDVESNINTSYLDNHAVIEFTVNFRAEDNVTNISL